MMYYNNFDTLQNDKQKPGLEVCWNTIGIPIPSHSHCSIPIPVYSYFYSHSHSVIM